MRILTTLVALAMVTSFAVVAMAAENDPACEDSQRAADGDTTTADSDKISDRTAPLRSATGVGACEGEHWEGEDQNGCAGGTGVTTLTNGGVCASYNGAGASGWKKPNPGTNGATDAVNVQASGSAASGASVCTGIFGVGNTCAAAVPTSGGAAVAWYGHDNTDQTTSATGTAGTFNMAYNMAHSAAGFGGHAAGPQGNVLAAAIHFAHVTIGQDVTEESTNCTQDSYVAGNCGRDNTAITVEIIP